MNAGGLAFSFFIFLSFMRGISSLLNRQVTQKESLTAYFSPLYILTSTGLVISLPL